ncbi:prepilin-type N-terminal cleavage/methylation domain-containing protein [Candidatus Curtissbacteria bacterium]|nr:prepilin-type N-terminal cleavage/methylation domain-containing protein [Candidatus Curtissbacteria bacterium]
MILKLMPFLKVNSKWKIVNRNRKSIHHSPFTIHLKVKHGFTLIELLIVITIIAILVGAGTVSWQNAQLKGRDSRRKVDLKAAQQALELYYQTNGKYPGSQNGNILCNITGDDSTKTWGSQFSCTPQGGSPVLYMQQLPKDPKYQSTSGYYFNNPSPNTYNLWAALENTLDPDLTQLPSSCSGWAPTGRNYCVINP